MISFIIPSYNRSSYLRQLLDSILKQDYDNIEIIVVDDNSADDTPTVMQEYVRNYSFIKYFRNPRNMGCGYNRGFGFNQSIGDYVIFADDDDYYTDNSFVTKSLLRFAEYPTLSFVSGNVHIKTEKSNDIKVARMNVSGFLGQKDYLENFNFKYDKPQSTFPTVFRRSSLIEAEIGQMKMVNDAAIYLRSLLYGDVYQMDEPVGVYRIHDTNITKSLSSDFIIENLSEKKYVYDKAIVSGIISNVDWMKEQFLLTVEYYFRWSKPTLLDLFKILKWAKANDISSHMLKTSKLYGDSKLRRLKNQVKSFLRNTAQQAKHNQHGNQLDPQQQHDR